MNKTINSVILSLVSLLNSTLLTSAQVLVAGWDFQSAPGTQISAFPAQNVFVANLGSGTMYLDGTNGSSSWGNFNRSGVAGTTVNLTAGFSNVTTDPAALRLVNTGGTGNNSYVSFSFNMTGYQNLVISYAGERNNVGFLNNSWEYSTDGGITWQPFHSVAPPLGGYGALTLPTTSALNNLANALVRMQLSGATNVSG